MGELIDHRCIIQLGQHRNLHQTARMEMGPCFRLPFFFNLPTSKKFCNKFQHSDYELINFSILRKIKSKKHIRISNWSVAVPVVAHCLILSLITTDSLDLTEKQVLRTWTKRYHVDLFQKRKKKRCLQNLGSLSSFSCSFSSS